MYSDEKSGMDAFDPEDIQAAVSSVAEEKAALEKAYAALWDVFSGISKTESSANVWQEHLREHESAEGFKFVSQNHVIFFVYHILV